MQQRTKADNIFNCNFSSSHGVNVCLCLHVQMKRGGGVGVRGLEDHMGERSGSVVECLTQDRTAGVSSLTGVTVLWSLSKTHLS